MNDTITPSSGNVFADLGFSPDDTAALTQRAEQLTLLRTIIATHGWTPRQASMQLNIEESDAADLMQGKWNNFSSEKLQQLDRVAEDIDLLNDPIAIKMNDTEALEKLMQQAVREAVDKARKLGFLPPADTQNTNEKS
jgi:predicted XRE-type DNA-binding protein